MDQDASDFARRQSGLTEAEATLLLAQVGPNVIRTEQIRRSFTSSPKRCASRHSSCFLSLPAFILSSEASAKAYSCFYKGAGRPLWSQIGKAKW